MNEDNKKKLSFLCYDLAHCLAEVSKALCGDAAAGGQEGPCEAVCAAVEGSHEESPASAASTHAAPQNEGCAVDNAAAVARADAGDENRTDASCGGDAEVVNDKPLEEKHLTRNNARGKPVGNVAFRKFLDCRTVAEGSYPLLAFYADFRRWCYESDLRIPLEKGMRYLLHRNGYVIAKVPTVSDAGNKSCTTSIIGIRPF